MGLSINDIWGMPKTLYTHVKPNDSVFTVTDPGVAGGPCRLYAAYFACLEAVPPGQLYIEDTDDQSDPTIATIAMKVGNNQTGRFECWPTGLLFSQDLSFILAADTGSMVMLVYSLE